MYFFSLLYTDERFPSDATVEFVFSSGPEKIKGWFTLLKFFLILIECLDHICQMHKEVNKSK